MTKPVQPDNGPSRQSVSTSLANWLRNHGAGTLLPAALVGFVLLTQWPMLKGIGYRLLGSTAQADGIPWRTDYAAALNESRQTGKPVLLDFTASWCPPCQVMKHEVWPDADVRQAVISSYIPILLDVDLPANQDIAKRYNVATIPTIIITDSQGQPLKEGSFMTRRALLSFLAP